jgi:hypothetical protein
LHSLYVGGQVCQGLEAATYFPELARSSHPLAAVKLVAASSNLAHFFSW